MFFQKDMKVFENNNMYARYEASLFKLVFSFYNQTKMTQHGFGDNKYKENVELIDCAVKKNGLTIQKSKDFYKLRVVQEIWFAPITGFKYSQEMKKFVKDDLKGQREAYITHFEKFCP